MKQDTIQAQWKPIGGFENYSVSNTGLVMNTKTGKLLKPKIAKTGYYCVSLCKPGIQKTSSVHRLVATAFIPNPNNLRTVDHINTNKLDNRVENLRWLSLEDNVRFYRTEQIPEEERERISNATRKRVVCIETGKVYKSLTEAGKAFNVTHTSISQCANGKSQTSCGLHFEFCG